MASPAFRSSTIPGTGSTAGITITKPTGVVDNDILVAFAYIESDAVITPPSGWTQKLLNEQNNGGEDHRLYCWWHRAASDGANYTWSWTGAAFNDFSVHAFSGALTSGDPFQQTNVAVAGAASTTTPIVSVTTTTADTTLIWAGSNFQSNSWNTDPTGFTAIYDPGYGSVYYKAQAAAGSSGNVARDNLTASYGTAMILSLASIADSSGTTLTVTEGTLSLTGQDVTLTAGGNVLVAVDNGTVTLSGQDVVLTAGSSFTIPVTNTTLSAQGQDVLFTFDTPWAEGGLTLTGSDVTLFAAQSVTLAVTDAALTLTGSDVTLLADFDYTLTVDNGAVTLTGQDVAFSVGAGSVTIVVDTGAITFTASDVGISPSFTISSSGSPRRKRYRGIRRILNVGR